jgi:hypothetical protein
MKELSTYWSLLVSRAVVRTENVTRMLHGESPNVHESAVKNPKMLGGPCVVSASGKPVFTFLRRVYPVRAGARPYRGGF